MGPCICGKRNNLLRVASDSQEREGIRSIPPGCSLGDRVCTAAPATPEPGTSGRAPAEKQNSVNAALLRGTVITRVCTRSAGTVVGHRGDLQARYTMAAEGLGSLKIHCAPCSAVQQASASGPSKCVRRRLSA